MATHKLFWREFSPVLAQWFGVGLASIVSGIALGIMLRKGIVQTEARAIALSLGFVLALAFWILIGRLFVVRPIECSVGMSPTSIQFEVSGGAYGPSPAFAAVVLCISIYTVHQSLPLHGAPTFTATNYHVLPKC